MKPIIHEKRTKPRPKLKKRKLTYRDGGLGFIKWCEDFVCIPVYHDGGYIPKWTPMNDLPTSLDIKTGRSYRSFWENQKYVLTDALQMSGGRFKHRLIIFCWPRGEGKSFVAVLIQMWKFFCFPRQYIMLGANSRDQTKFVHYQIFVDIILNSPKLLRIIGRKNIQEKEIKLRDGRGNIGSFIRTISTSTGIVSNVTGYTFSEMFDMSNPKFFIQLDGSIRNIPNALGVIDSTVSSKSHILYKLYLTYIKNKDPFLFFSHRESIEAQSKDYWSPQMSQDQLDSYQNKFPTNEFAQYFKNTWEAGSRRFFTIEMIDATNYLGVDGTLGMQQKIIDILSVVNSKKTAEKLNLMRKVSINLIDLESLTLQKPLIKVSSIYSLTDSSRHPRKCSNNELQKLSDLYQTDFAILIGIDRADPMKLDLAAGARTIVTAVAKGLPNSRNNPDAYIEEGLVKEYIYLLLHLVHVESNELSHVKAVIKSCIDEYDGIEALCSERWGMWDINDWCTEQDISFEPISPSYDRQKEAFSELWTLYKTGKFKTPEICISGSKKDDILKEEAYTFDHNPFKKHYGSTEKVEKFGVQDDSIYSLAWCIYGGRLLGPLDFRERKSEMVFGEMFKNKQLIGNY
jgi:hypothetical protein